MRDVRACINGKRSLDAAGDRTAESLEPVIGSASTQVLSAAQSLCAESNRLKLEAGRFLDSVRAAWLLK